MKLMLMHNELLQTFFHMAASRAAPIVTIVAMVFLSMLFKLFSIRGKLKQKIKLSLKKAALKAHLESNGLLHPTTGHVKKVILCRISICCRRSVSFLK